MKRENIIPFVSLLAYYYVVAFILPVNTFTVFLLALIGSLIALYFGKKRKNMGK